MYILRPDIAEDEVTNHIDKYNKLLEEFGGTILDSQMRGKRRLAYQIAKHREGIYVQLSHQGDGQHIFKIEKAMRLSEDVIRYMTVKQEGPLPAPRSSNKTTSQLENKDDSDVLLFEGRGVGKGPSCLTVIYLITSSLSLIAFSILKICCPLP